jgi:nucleotide-binding universal stress UspA family protein
VLRADASTVEVMRNPPGYRRILVPIAGNPESEKAMDVACRIAAARSGVITAVAVVEVPALLPLDAHMTDEESRAHQILERAAAIADSYGVGVSTRRVRAREAASAILDQAALRACEIIVLGAPRRRRPTHGPIFGSTVEHVLKRAPCRVMLIGAAPADVYAINAAA